MEPTKALSFLNGALREHGLTDSGWTGGLDRAARRFGVCRGKQKRITLSLALVRLNEEDEVRDTVLHEIAHALALEEFGVNCGHDDRWKAICVRIGARPSRCFDGEEVRMPKGTWFLIHRDTAEVYRSYTRRPGRSDHSETWIRGRKRETYGKLLVVSARELPLRQARAAAEGE
jgi:hypothetical protein